MKVVAKILLYNSHGRILVLRRGETHPHFPGHLDLPGGEVEAGEQVDQAAVREVREETGLHILPEEISLTFEALLNAHTKHILYTGHVTANDAISLSWEHTEYQWLTPQQIVNQPLPEGVDPYYANVVKYLAQYERTH